MGEGSGEKREGRREWGGSAAANAPGLRSRGRGVGEAEQRPSRPKPPLQFGIRALLAITALVGLLFGVLRWLGVPPLASAMVLLILVVSVAAALGLVFAIAAASEDDR